MCAELKRRWMSILWVQTRLCTSRLTKAQYCKRWMPAALICNSTINFHSHISPGHRASSPYLLSPHPRAGAAAAAASTCRPCGRRPSSSPRWTWPSFPWLSSSILLVVVEEGVGATRGDASTSSRREFSKSVRTHQATYTCQELPQVILSPLGYHSLIMIVSP